MEIPYAHHYHVECSVQEEIPIAIRHEWNDNNGYCGETSLIATGMLLGQYMSQYTAREIANQFSQNAQDNQLLINDDASDSSLISEFGLIAKLPSSINFSNGSAFLAWIRSEINLGHPVVIGVYENHSFFGSDLEKPDPQYDHIVTVTSIDETHITLQDHGLYTPDGSTPIDTFIIPINEFTKDRIFDPPGSDHLAKDSPADNSDFPYAISNTSQCFGFAIAGCTNPSSYSISVTANQSGEPDLVGVDPNNHYSPITQLTLNIKGLTPGNYYLYEFRSPGGPNTPPPIFPSSDLQHDETQHPVLTAPPTPGLDFYGIIKYPFTIPSILPPTTISINSSDTTIFRCVPIIPKKEDGGDENSPFLNREQYKCISPLLRKSASLLRPTHYYSIVFFATFGKNSFYTERDSKVENFLGRRLKF